MKTKTTPAPKRAGTSKATRHSRAKIERAHRHARQFMDLLGDDPEALAIVIAAARLINRRKRDLRRAV